MPSMRMRILVVVSSIGLLLVIATVKAAMLQINRGSALYGLSQQQTLRKAEYLGSRGDILDRNGHLLATSVTVSSVFAEPRLMSEPKKVAFQLAKVLPQSTDLVERLNSNRSFVWILRRADPNIVNKILGFKLQGIKVMQENRRFYPNHALLGQTLGLVSIDGKSTGGIEKALDFKLEQKVWRTKTLIDARGDGVRNIIAPSHQELDGLDITLTIDRNLQHFAEETLLNTVRAHGAKGGWAVVMRPQTGEILAMVNVPLFNPNRPNMAGLESARNQAISRSGEPGSVFKIVTFASALENRLIKPNDIVDCENGVYNAGFMTIKDVVKRKNVTITEAFMNSSNIGTYKIAQKVGPERLYETIKKFGFGEPPGLGLLEEAKGSVPLPGQWGKARFANISFGYGVMATSLQMLQVASAIANDGLLVPPKILLENDNPPVPRRVLSQDAAQQVRDLMFADTMDGGTGKRARIDGIDVAGKTGTTEKLDPKTGRYSKSHNLSSFVGFAPVISPQIAAIVVIDEPKGIAYGGYVAAPAWQQIVSAALERQGVTRVRKEEKSFNEARAISQSKQR